VGYGRKVTEEGFNKKLDSLDVYQVVDKRDINNLKIIEINKEDIEKMMNQNLIGKNKSISSKNFYEFYDRNK
jgi:hypothetical protein